MEKIEADIFNILHNTKIRLQGDAEDNYGFMGKGYAEKLAIEIAKEIQPSEKKVLSVEDMKKIMWDLENKLGYQPAYETIAQAIESALPAQREVRYPEKLDHDHSCEFDCKGCISNGWNQAIDEFKKLNGG